MRAKKKKADPVTLTAPAARLTFVHILLIAAGLAILLSIVYAPALHGPLLFDDRALPYGQRQLRDAPLRVWLAGVRPMLMFTYWLNYQFSGIDTFGYHLLNILIHAVNGLLVFFLFRRLPAGKIVLAGIGAAIFLLHPLQTESVAYITGRSELLTGFLLLSATLVFLRPENSSWKWAILVAALAGAAILSKEQALAVIPLFLLLESGWVENAPDLKARFTESVKKHWRLWGLLIAAGCLGGVFVLRVLSQSESAGFGMADRPAGAYFLTECRVIFRYIQLFLLPLNQNIDPHPPLSHTLTDYGAGFCLAAIVVLLWICFRWRRRAPLATFGFLLFLILLAPTSSFVPLWDPLAEHCMYLPMLGLILILMDGASRLSISELRAAVAVTCLLFACAALTFQRSRVWSSATALAEDAAAALPMTGRSFSLLAQAYLAENRPKEFLERIAKNSPPRDGNKSMFTDWAVVLAAAGRDEEAVQKLDRALEFQTDAFALGLKGFLEARIGRTQSSLADLNRAIALAPEFDIAYCYRGYWFLAAKQYESAVEDFQRALAMNPFNTVAREGLRESERQRSEQPLSASDGGR